MRVKIYGYLNLILIRGFSQVEDVVAPRERTASHARLSLQATSNITAAALRLISKTRGILRGGAYSFIGMN